MPLLCLIHSYIFKLSCVRGGPLHTSFMTVRQGSLLEMQPQFPAPSVQGHRCSASPPWEPVTRNLLKQLTLFRKLPRKLSEARKAENKLLLSLQPEAGFSNTQNTYLLCVCLGLRKPSSSAHREQTSFKPWLWCSTRRKSKPHGIPKQPFTFLQKLYHPGAP